jgi:hypothetical protein
LLTAHGEAAVRRAYYYCGRCRQSFLPYDEALGLTDEIRPGLTPLVCLAGTLPPFADAAQDVLKRFAGVRTSASTVLRCTEASGERLRAQQKEGRMVEHRMLYTALLYTPDKEHTRYLVDFDLEALAQQVRWQAQACGVSRWKT